jgi:hypothetical protein
MKYLYFFLFICCTSTCFSQTPETDQKKSKEYLAGQAYGFLNGQQAMLNKYENDFKDLVPEIKRVKTLFELNFGQSFKNIETYFKTMYSAEFTQFETLIKTEIEKAINSKPASKEIAANFILTVEKRAKGEIPSPTLETILAFEFQEQPEQEFKKNYTTNFSTKGLEKAKGIDIQMTVPKSWKANDVENPIIVKQFVYSYAIENPTMMISSKDLGSIEGTKEEINEMLTEDLVRGMVPANGKFISFKKVTILGSPGAMLEVESTVTKGDITAKVRMVQYMFIKDNKMGAFQGTVSSTDLEKDLGPLIKKYLPLFELVVGSIVSN